MRQKHVIVTGANGFVGRNLIPTLRNQGHAVTVVSRRAEKMFGNRVSYKKADLTRELPDSIVRKADAIVHLASDVDINGSVDRPREHVEKNVAMTLSVLEAARASGRKPLIVFASTDRVYGRTKKRTVSESDPRFPMEPYTASKMLCEDLLAAYAHLYAIPYIALRFDSIYGPHQPRKMFISDVIQKMITTDRVETGPLSVKKNFIYVSDVVDAIMVSLEAPPRAYDQIYNIGGPSASLRELRDRLQGLISRKLKKKIVVSETTSMRRPLKTEVVAFALSTAKAQRLLGWRARTPLRKGLERTVDYFIARANNA